MSCFNRCALHRLCPAQERKELATALDMLGVKASPAVSALEAFQRGVRRAMLDDSHVANRTSALPKSPSMKSAKYLHRQYLVAGRS